MIERSQCTHGAPVACAVVVEGEEHHPWAFGSVPSGLDAGERLTEFLSAPIPASVTGMPERTHPHSDDLRMPLPNRIVAETQPLGDAAGEVLDENVRVLE